MAARLTALLTILAASAALAQSPTDELVEAPHVKEYVTLTLADEGEGRFTYRLDGPHDNALSDPLPKLLTVTADPDNPPALVLSYLNPIRYRWSTTEELRKDTSFEAAQRFGEALNTLLALVNPPDAAAQLAAASMGLNVTRGMSRGGNGLRAAEPGGKALALYAPELLEWSLWLTQEPMGTCLISEGGAGETRKQFLAALQMADEHVFGAAPRAEAVPARASTQFSDLSRKTLESLERAESLAALKGALESTTKDVSTLTDWNGAATRALDAVKDALAKLSWGPAERCEAFKHYTDASVGRFMDSAAVTLKARRQLVADLASLHGSLQELVKSAATEGQGGGFRVASVELPDTQMREVTVVIHRRKLIYPEQPHEKLTFEDEKEFKATLRVRRRPSFILEFAPGIVVTHVVYPRFGTTEVNGQTVVAAAGSDVQRVAAVGMLNIIPNFGFRGPLWLVAQVGIGTGPEHPLLLAGGGLRFSSPVNISLTAGAAWAWKQELQQLTLGEPVSGTADVERDVGYRLDPVPSFFIGVQRAF